MTTPNEADKALMGVAVAAALYAEERWVGGARVKRQRSVADFLAGASFERRRQETQEPHTCHNECHKPLCQMRRERDEYLRAWNFVLKDRDSLSSRLEAAEKAMEFSKMTIEHALALDYLGEGSTNGMAKDALFKLERALSAGGA